MENISGYLVKQPKQVLTHLKTLASEKCLITASFGDNSSFLTAILDINEKKQLITIDCGPKEYLNKELLSQGVVQCKTVFSGIKVLFEGRNVKKAGKVSDTALSIALPESLYWIQRRQFYRVRSPLSKDSFCNIPIQNEALNKAENTPFKLFDLSATGFSILSDTIEQADQLETLSEYNNCTLTLENSATQVISFTVRSKHPINQLKPNKNQRIGCEFINLPPRSESTFLRYMQDIEREIKRTKK